MDIPALVFDASAALALALSEREGAEMEETAREIIEKNGQLIVPALFWFEVENGLLSALRQERITGDELSSIEHELSVLPFVTDQPPPPHIRQRIRELAVKNTLTVYDASYLELALRHDLRLKTLDTHLLGLKESYPVIM